MFKRKLRFLLLLPALFIVMWPGSSDFRTKVSPIASVEPKLITSEPCKHIQVTTVGVACETKYGFTARVAFPNIDLKRVLAGDGYLPQADAVFTEKQTTIESKIYRNIDFSLEWAPVTPEYLQIYIHEYIPYWGNRVPYRLFWSARHDECSLSDCGEWHPVNQKGEILPPDVEGLRPDLAADSNFNGVPAAFWNVHIVP
jgi:hypothetical protein